ncbi:MAG: hypothetical protein ACREYF_07330 [Gammaproteobacteria bacterium]
MNRHTRRLPVLRMTMATLALAAAAPAAWAVEFPEAELFFELNDLAGDLWIHTSIDGPPWTKLKITDPNKHTILNITPKGRLRTQGLTQLFIESAEPSFDELAPEKFFRRFPPGAYVVTAPTLDGHQLQSTVMLSQVMAARPDNIVVNGVPSVTCDVPPFPTVSAPVLVDWDAVTTSHPEIGESGPVEIVRYQFFVEQTHDTTFKFSVDLPPSKTEFEIPTEILALSTDFKYEIIARTTSGNNTAVEACFTLE